MGEELVSLVGLAVVCPQLAGLFPAVDPGVTCLLPIVVS
jgi:hypothetical protein